MKQKIKNKTLLTESVKPTFIKNKMFWKVIITKETNITMSAYINSDKLLNELWILKNL